jgi:hypothetical protein
MLILFLDDMPERVARLRSDEEIFYVRSPDEMKEWLTLNGTPDIISFDQDLSEEHYFGDGGYSNPNRPLSGTDCAKWCVEKGFIPKMVLVHSWNRSGADNIASCFTRQDCLVFQYPFRSKEYHVRNEVRNYYDRSKSSE